MDTVEGSELPRSVVGSAAGGGSDASVQVDVVVVGLGPVGSVLAGLLGRRGIRVAAIDKDPDVFALPRAAHIDHQGLRTLQELGLLDDLLPGMRRNPGLDFVNSARRILMRVPADRPSRSGLPTSMYFYQPHFDRRLRRLADELPDVQVHLGTEAVAIEQDDTRAVVHARGPAGDIRFEAPWVVGCDGARSPVREWLGISLDDLDFDEQWLVVDVRLTAPETSLPPNAVHVCDPGRPHTVIPMPEPRYRFELMLLPGETAEQMQDTDQIRRLIKPWVSAESVEIERSAVYEFHGLSAREWRRGRFFIAGDAAHQMPPFLGQGMCSGLRDAANLAWKLDEVIRGRAPAAILDTYFSEREPHVRKIIEDVVDFGKIICTLDPEEAEERDRRMLAGETGAPFGLPRLKEGPLVTGGGGALAIQPPGRSGERLDDVVGPRFLVVGRDENAFDSSVNWWRSRGSVLVTTLAEIGEHRAGVESSMDRLGVDVMVVRPDRYLLGAGNRLAPITEVARRALTVISPARGDVAVPSA
ncbi:3-(3-hydroxy-phenyl)propionate hydroxylase [Sinosporangium album]|uniref:3-(3-hydroxy-phenyl)propionate hydroxylase n=1 Tax=Sinosporangium album TaxID=504805 RepID=A0A1G7ZU74_9ACTN|nr:bifunctional 3-(3-hydroxy-phenyl)propionate/3-hydroxycinnamic acid hydroxylase [Sinosporangium album]SDH12147.1 3-(3-hydroxy-phenyl)propionate hydroxylase [Sinosporangium album]